MRFTSKMAEAAMLLAHGSTVTEAAAAVDVTYQTVYNWLKRDDFSAAYDQELSKRLKMLKSKAVKVVERVMDSENEWAALAAANATFSQVNRLDGFDSQAGVSVTFLQSMPPPALPEQEIQQPLLPDIT